MRLASLLSIASLLVPALAADAAHWASIAASSPDGVIPLTSATYDEILSSDRDYGVTIILTALPAQYKCQPCHDFDPVFRAVTKSWTRVPRDDRDTHFFAQLDFQDGQAIYQRLSLASAPTIYYHPPLSGERKAENGSPVNYDLNRAGLGLPALHTWVKSTTPVAFDIYKPMNPVPFIVAPIVLAGVLYVLWSARAIVVPIVQSRLVWGVASIIMCLTFTSGFMWNKIKNAPYVQAGQDGRINWIAGGYSNQLGLESQVVGVLYGVLALCVLVLSVLIPSQGSPIKQRVGTYLWLGMLIVLFSLLIRMFRVKNGGYPFTIL